MTENTLPAIADDGAIDATVAPPVVDPLTGETVDVLELDGAGLAAGLDRVAEVRDRVADYKAAIVAEVARRADAQAVRKIDLGAVTFEVNAPTTDNYDLEDLLAELRPLVEAGKLDEAVLERLTRYPPRPPAPAPAVDKTRLNALKASDDRDVLAAIARARRRGTNARTAKIVARATEATATELDQ